MLSAAVNRRDVSDSTVEPGVPGSKARKEPLVGLSLRAQDAAQRFVAAPPIRPAIALQSPGAPVRAALRQSDAGALTYRFVRGQLTVDGVGSTDVLQGVLGNCFFLATLSAVAEVRPDIIERMVRTRGSQFVVRVYDLDSGEPVHHVIDNALPLAEGDRYRYARSSDPGELWVPLAEQGYALRYGGYAAIADGGKVDLAMREVTGHEAVILKPMTSTPDAIWDRLEINRTQRLPATATVRGASLTACDRAPNGLLVDHAYAILKSYASDGKRWVVLRDPNGTVSYSADYDTVELGADGKPQRGVFRMTVEDFALRMNDLVSMVPAQLDPTKVPRRSEVRTPIAPRHSLRYPPPPPAAANRDATADKAPAPVCQRPPS